MTIWKGKLKIELNVLVDCYYETVFLNILTIGPKYLSFYPPSFFNIHKVINFKVFPDEQFFLLLCRFIYKFRWHFFIYHSWSTFNFDSTYNNLPFIKVTILFWCSFSIKLSWFQRRHNKIDIIPYDRFYLLDNL